MAIKTIFVEQPTSWDAVSTSLRQLSRECARTVRFTGAIEDLEIDFEAIDVVVFGVSGMANYALEIHEKGMLDIPDDTIGMHLACRINANVLVPDEMGFPHAWLLRPNGMLEQVLLDADKLRTSQVEYRIGEPSDAPKSPVGREFKS